MRFKNFRIGGALVAGAAVLVTVALAASANASTFDGNPPSPLSYPSVSPLDGWDIQVHDRDAQNHPGTTANMSAEHGTDCSAPPASHSTGTAVSAHVFQCANHIMTALNGPDYGVIYLTPPEMVDFANGGVVSWDMSTEKDSTRDWWDVTVSPFLDSQALPLLSALSQGVDLQDPNRNSIVVTTDNGEGAPNLEVVTNGNQVGYGPPGWAGHRLGEGATGNQAMNRLPMKLTITRTHIRFERLASPTAPALVYIDQNIPQLAWTQGVIQFGHHSYNPTKDNAGVPATWHWDNITASPSVPFFIEREQDWTRGGTVTTSPAPANSYLRFSAICRPVVDGSMPPKMTDSGHPEHFASYLVPVAVGSTSHALSFQSDDWFGGPCLAKDISLFSLTGTAPPSTPTSIPATSTPTTVPATATPTQAATNTPTSTPVATATNTPIPTATRTATPTATPTQEVCTARRGTSVFGQKLYTGHVENGVCVP